MPAAKNKECKKAIRFISNSTKNYTQPESLDGWCKLAKTKVGYDKCADSFSRLIRYRLDRIEDLKGYSLMEKVRLVFLFSRPVTDVFVKELNDNKCVVKLNDEKKITYFRSPDGNYVLQSEQDSKGRKRKFKEKPIHAKERIASRNDDCEKAIKFMSNGIKNCTEPESLIRWCELAKTETEYDKSADSFVSIIKIRLNRIEDLKGYSLMEKVRLVFLFSRPLSDVFVEELKDTKCIVELNDKRKITYFRSPTGDCVLQSDQDPNPNIRRFKGKAIHDNLFNRDDDCEKAIKFMSNGIKNCTQPESLIRWCEVAKTETGYDKCASSFSFIITRRLDKIEDLKGYSLTEKVHLVFMFSRPVSPEFLRILREEKCVVKLNGSERIAYFRSPDGTCVLQSDHNNLEKYFKGKPYFHKMRKAYIKVRSSDNVQDPPPPASPQSLPDPPEIDDVEMRNGEEEAAPEQEKQENEALERKKEKNKGTSTKQKSILHTEEDEDVTTESIQQEAPFNGPIDYDDMDIEEYPEFMVSNEIEPPMQHNKRHRTPSQENPKRRKIDKPEEPELANPPEINDVETRNEEGEEAPEKILETVPDIERSGRQCITRVTDEWDIQNHVAEKERDAALEQKPETFDDVGRTDVSESLNIQAQDAQARDQENNQPQDGIQNTQNGVKIEDSQEGTEQEPEASVPEEKAEMPALEKISLLKLTEQIEALAFNINLEGCFQQKALRAVRLFEAKDQLISIQDFNQLFNIVLKNLKSGRLQNPTGSSMKLVRLFEHFKRSLIRPLGDGLMVDALAILNDEIRKLGESEDEIPVKTIQTKLDSLMHLLTNTWADLDQ